MAYQTFSQESGGIRTSYHLSWFSPPVRPIWHTSPEGLQDNTHFNELGARRMAELVLDGFRELELCLEDRIVKPAK